MLSEQIIFVTVDYNFIRYNLSILPNKPLLHLIYKVCEVTKIDIKQLVLLYLNSVNLVDEKTFSSLENKSSTFLSDFFNKKKFITLKADQKENASKTLSLNYKDVVMCSCAINRAEIISRKTSSIKCMQCYKNVEDTKIIDILHQDYKESIKLYMNEILPEIEKVKEVLLKANSSNFHNSNSSLKIKMEILHKEILIKYETINQQLT